MHKLVTIGIVAVALASTPAQARWITSWTAAPYTPDPIVGSSVPPPSYGNRTLRQVLRLSAGGRAVRVRFTNAYGTSALKIASARIALLDEGGQEVPGSSHALSFGGESTIVVPRAAPSLSDAVPMDVPALARLVVSFYLPDEPAVCTCHMTGLDTIQVSAPGDFSSGPFTPQTTGTNRAFIAAVEVDAARTAATVVAIGDSITDGVGSTPKANHRWPDLLAERLVRRGGPVWGVANQGFSGNRLLADGAGDNALARLDRDVFSLAGVKALIVFEGVNDLGFASGKLPGMRGKSGTPNEAMAAAPMIVGYRQIAERAHALGIKVYGATIAPYKGAFYWTPEGESVRQEINRFIRTAGVFDAVLDFDKVLADPADPAAIRAGLHPGDHLHGNDAGYKALADSIDLRLFRR